MLREFADFEPIGKHQKSGMPLTREFRLFFLDGEPIQVSRYWDQGEYQGEMPPRWLISLAWQPLWKAASLQWMWQKP